MRRRLFHYLDGTFQAAIKDTGLFARLDAYSGYKFTTPPESNSGYTKRHLAVVVLPFGVFNLPELPIALNVLKYGESGTSYEVFLHSAENHMLALERSGRNFDMAM